jgi:hypothetical protein
MRTGMVFVVGALLFGMAAAPAFAETKTVRGTLVDLACYSKDKANTTNAHKGMGDTCAQDCAKKGMPAAIVTSDGQVYQLTGGLAANNNAKLVPHMSHTVEVTGDVTTKDGKMTIAANDVKMIGK